MNSYCTLRVALGALAFCLCGVFEARAQNRFSTESANIYLRDHDWKELLAYSQAWTMSEPDNSLVWEYLGNTLLIGLNRPDKAVAPLENAVSINPQSAE